jgi:hypothetical protein
MINRTKIPRLSFIFALCTSRAVFFKLCNLKDGMNSQLWVPIAKPFHSAGSVPAVAGQRLSPISSSA